MTIGALIGAASACASSTTQTSSVPDVPSKLGCLAVLPFANFSTSAHAGKQVAALIANELLVSGYYNVLEPEEAQAILEEKLAPPSDDEARENNAAAVAAAAAAAAATGALPDAKAADKAAAAADESLKEPVRTREKAIEVGKLLGVPGVLFGSVLSVSREDLASRAPGKEASISFTATLVRVDTGQVVWSVMTSSMDFPYILPGQRTPMRLAAEMVPKVVAPLLAARGAQLAEHRICWQRGP